MMTEETTATPSVEQAPAETLDDIYKSIETTARQFTQATAPTPPEPVKPATPDPSVPDPVMDPEGYKRFFAELHTQTRAVSERQRQLEAERAQALQAEHQRREREDITRAVDYVRKKVDLDPDLIEGALFAQALKDQRFADLFTRRYDHPDKWEKAVNVFAQQIGNKFAAKADPQLAENQRAIKASQGASLEPARNDDPLLSASAGEFDAAWQRLVSNM
jgi:hypothetical protein